MWKLKLREGEWLFLGHTARNETELECEPRFVWLLCLPLVVVGRGWRGLRESSGGAVSQQRQEAGSGTLRRWTGWKWSGQLST